MEVAALLGVVWLWVAIFESFTRSGLWRVLDDAFGAVRTMPGQAAVLVACILLGWFVIAAAAALGCSALARGRRSVAKPLPVARLLETRSST